MELTTRPPLTGRRLFARRLVMTVVGVLGTGVGVAFLRLAVLGMDPFQALMGGLSATFSGLAFGTLWVIVNVVLLGVALAFQRRLIGIGTLINLTLLGYVIDGSHRLLLHLLPTGNVAGRLAYLVVGVLILCVTAALYFTADMGVSTYDAVALILAERRPRVPFKYWRVLCDSTCVVAGAVLFLTVGRPTGPLLGLVGLGTVVVALCMGPLIVFFTDRVARPLLA